MFKAYKEIIDAWPSLDVFAGDVQVSANTAKQMRTRDSIAPEHWPRVVEAAAKRKIKGITLDLLARLRAQQRRVA